jgi:predicted  nucleic acid-binding Zn-ribbon protein
VPLSLRGARRDRDRGENRSDRSDDVALTLHAEFFQLPFMVEEIEQLLVLQDRDRKMRALTTELKLAPQERQALEEKLAAAMKQLETAKQQGREIEVHRKKLENDAATKRESIARFNTQKFQTRKNEEFQALTNEIKRFEGEIEKIEDEELELMEQAEQQKARVAEAESQANALKTQVARQLQNLEEKTKTIDAQLADLQKERGALAAAIDEELLDTYNRLFSSKGQSAVVSLEHDHCMGCHMKVTASTSARVKARKEVVHCEQCGRILYWQD